MTDKTANYPRNGLIGWLCVLKWEGMREVDRANERRVNLYAMGWGLSIMGVAALIAFLDLPQVLDWALAAIPILFGILSLRAYLKLLHEADEMLRQMQLEAMAVGFGTGLIVGMTCVLFDLPSVAIVASMCLAFTIRVILAARAVAHDAQLAESERD